MMKFGKIFSTVLALALLLLLQGCSGETKSYTSGPYYFETWAYNYSSPKQPKNELSKDVAIKRDTYIEVYYNDNGTVLSITKYTDGKKSYIESYEYSKNGELKTSHAESYDRNGNVLQSKQ